MPNPLLTPFETAPFSKITNAHFQPAIETLIGLTKDEISKITDQSESPNFANTVEALERTGIQLDRVTSLFFNLNSAETNKEIQAIAQAVSPLLTNFKNDLLLNEALFDRVKWVYDQRDSLNLNAEQRRLLEKQFKGFARNGALLNETKKKSSGLSIPN